MLFMANNSKQVNNTNHSSFQQILALINKVSIGQQPDLRVDVQNLKLNFAKTRLIVNAKINVKLPPPKSTE
jgi:hypothetical protein